MARVTAHSDETGRMVLDVALSEGNLLVLLSKLYTPASKCEFHSYVPDGVAQARIRAEIDEVHYASPTRLGAPPGDMHPVAEAVLKEIRAIFGATAGGGSR